jgi:hypothetical protein
MSFEKAIKNLKKALKCCHPRDFRSSWVFMHCPDVYRYIIKNSRTEVGDIDWDKIISSLDKRFQRIWIPPRHKAQRVRLYRNKKEVDLILKNYKEKLYIFIAALNDEDKRLRDAIAIPLVRIAQKGNIRAQQKLVFLLKQIAQQWIEYCPTFYRWRGHSDDLEPRILACIRCYRFTGSFIGYLFKSLELSGKGLQRFQAYSLDSYIPGTTIQMIDTLTKDPQTGEVVKAIDVSSYHFH